MTHEDGTTSEVDGLVTRLGVTKKSETTKTEKTKTTSTTTRTMRGTTPPTSNDRLKIEEIGQDTLKREIRQANDDSVRVVPIKLPDGRLLQRDPDETMEIKTEFTQFCHQEYPEEKKSKASQERVVPITLEASGESVMPSFTTLDDLEPPEWSAFNPRFVRTDCSFHNRFLF